MDNHQKQMVKYLLQRIMDWTIFESWDQYLSYVIEHQTTPAYPIALWNNTAWSVISGVKTTLTQFDPFSNLEDAYTIFRKAWPLLTEFGKQELTAHLFQDQNTLLAPIQYLNIVIGWEASLVTSSVYDAIVIQDAEIERLTLLKEGIFPGNSGDSILQNSDEA
jgi:hypothetical protein